MKAVERFPWIIQRCSPISNARNPPAALPQLDGQKPRRKLKGCNRNNRTLAAVGTAIATALKFGMVLSQMRGYRLTFGLVLAVSLMLSVNSLTISSAR